MLIFTSMKIDRLGSDVRRRRKELGIDQADLAGVSVHTVSDIESGKANPTLEVLNRVLRVLGLELALQPRTP